MVKVVLEDEMRPPRGLLHPSTDNRRALVPNLAVLRAITAFACTDEKPRPSFTTVQYDIEDCRLSAANGYIATQAWCAGSMASLEPKVHEWLATGKVALCARDLRAIGGRANSHVLLHSCERLDDDNPESPVSVLWLQVGRGLWPVHNEAAPGTIEKLPDIDAVFDEFGEYLANPDKPARVGMDPQMLAPVLKLADAFRFSKVKPTLELYVGAPEHAMVVYMANRKGAAMYKAPFSQEFETLARCAVMPLHLKGEWLIDNEEKADDAEAEG